MASDIEYTAIISPSAMFGYQEPAGFMEAVHLVKLLQEAGRIVEARAATGTVNVMIAASHGKCRESLPDADIELITKHPNTLVFRCHHTPPHEWPA